MTREAAEKFRKHQLEKYNREIADQPSVDVLLDRLRNDPVFRKTTQSDVIVPDSMDQSSKLWTPPEKQFTLASNFTTYIGTIIEAYESITFWGSSPPMEWYSVPVPAPEPELQPEPFVLKHGDHDRALEFD